MSEFWQKKMRTYFQRIDFDHDGAITKKDFEGMADRFIKTGKFDDKKAADLTATLLSVSSSVFSCFVTETASWRPSGSLTWLLYSGVWHLVMAGVTARCIWALWDSLFRLRGWKQSEQPVWVTLSWSLLLSLLVSSSSLLRSSLRTWPWVWLEDLEADSDLVHFAQNTDPWPKFPTALNGGKIERSTSAKGNGAFLAEIFASFALRAWYIVVKIETKAVSYAM